MENTATVVHFGKDGKSSVILYTGTHKELTHESHLVITENKRNEKISEQSAHSSHSPIEGHSVLLQFYDEKSIDVLISQLYICKRLLTDEEFRNKRAEQSFSENINVDREIGNG